jgi:hypothetical protein
MFEMAPKGVSVHFGRMISRGADGTLNGIEARIATQIEHLDESVEMLSMIKPDVIALAHTATSYYLGREKEVSLTKRLEDRFGLHFITAFLGLTLQDKAGMQAYLDVPVESSDDGEWKAPDGTPWGAVSPGSAGINLWKGFQRRHARGMQLNHLNAGGGKAN